MAVTRAIEFGGFCTLQWCGSHNDSEGRGGVEIALNGSMEDGFTEMICCDCALRLARLLKKRVKEVAEKQAKGLEYRGDPLRWMKTRAVAKGTGGS